MDQPKIKNVYENNRKLSIENRNFIDLFIVSKYNRAKNFRFELRLVNKN